MSPECVNEATTLVLKAYGGHSEDIATLRTGKYLAGKGSLKCLPPTDNAFQQHLKRVSLATHVMKNSHVANPEFPSDTEYSWQSDNVSLMPVTMTIEPWPHDLPQSFNYKYRNGCKNNCSCGKIDSPCHVACWCLGDPSCCSRVSQDSDDEQGE